MYSICKAVTQVSNSSSPSTSSDENDVAGENSKVDLSQSMSNTSAHKTVGLLVIQHKSSDFAKCAIKLSEGLDVVECENIAREWFDHLENVSEAYLLTLLASLGILFNFLAIVIVSRDRQMRPMTKILNHLFLCTEQVFLGLTIVYFQMRSRCYKLHIPKTDPSRLEQFNYLTSALGAAQTFAVWMLYVASMDAYRSVRQLAVPEKIFQIRRAPLYVLLLVVSIVGYYALYLPPVRVELFHTLESYSNFTLCNVPFENNWDFVSATDEQRSDIFYILVYSVGFLVFAYVLPFVFICCRDKDIIDVLHVAQVDRNALQQQQQPNKSYVLYPAVVTSVTCNVYLVCVALKMVILTFRVFDYAVHYLTDSALVFFRYLNVYSNFLQVLKSSLHLFILVIYDRRLKDFVLMKMRRKRGDDSRNDDKQ